MAFLKKTNYRSDFGKKRRGKSSEIRVKFEKLEKMSKWTRLDSKCPGLWKSDKKKMTVVFLVIDWRTGMDFTKSKVSLKN